MKKVLVLMSTYNGEKYIKEQLDSIFLQQGVDVHCLIRDDGSTDKTIEIINNYRKHNPKIDFKSGENIGWARSFYELVESIRYADYDYYSFSDQDDKWDSMKLISAVEKLENLNADKPLLYCSNLKIVDNNLNWSGELRFKKVNVSKKHALIENFSTGCTQVFNNKLKDLFLNYKPDYLHAHDYWIYLICIFTGEIIYDKNAYINYRQHNSNVIGASTDIQGLWEKRIKLITDNRIKGKLNQHPLEYMAQELLKGYRDYISKEDIKIIETVACYRDNLWKRLKLFFKFDMRKISLYENIEFRVRVLLGIA